MTSHKSFEKKRHVKKIGIKYKHKGSKHVKTFYKIVKFTIKQI